MLGVPGTGKSMTMKCCSGEFCLPLSSMQASNLYSKWVGDTDKILANMLRTVEEIGGILGIDEFQRFLPQGGSGESGGLENRMLGTLLTWFNDQKSTVILSAANNIANLPDEITRSGRVDALFFVGFPGSEAKSHAWEMYMQRHDLADQELPTDQYWTPADIASCCRLAEMQRVDIKTASKWITPSYEKNKEQMDNLLEWAEAAGCICAETGDRFKAKDAIAAVAAPKRVVRKVTRAKE
jgi:SpoVK/Ycf46/Vps4 family AAA+-type ATPase